MSKETVYLDLTDQNGIVVRTVTRKLTVYLDRLGIYVKDNGNKRYFDAQNHFRSPAPVAISFYRS